MALPASSRALARSPRCHAASTSRGKSSGAAPAAAPKPAKAALLITFETNATVLTAGAKRELDIVGRALNTSRLADFNFVIEGHADPRGSAEKNQRLSEGRASAVREYLVQNQSVRDDRLKAVGKGDREPLNSNNPAAPEPTFEWIVATAISARLRADFPWRRARTPRRDS